MLSTQGDLTFKNQKFLCYKWILRTCLSKFLYAQQNWTQTIRSETFLRSNVTLRKGGPRSKPFCLGYKAYRESLDLTPNPKLPVVRNNQPDERRSRGGNSNSDRKGCASPRTGTTPLPHVLVRGDKLDPKTLVVNKGQLVTSQSGDNGTPTFSGPYTINLIAHANLQAFLISKLFPDTAFQLLMI